MSNNQDNGNAAAMREALNQLCDWALLDINENAIRSDEPSYKKLVDGIVEITNAALTAPPRNCDRPFRVFEEAIGAYVAERGDGPHLGYCDAIKWALAPAEGGTE